MMVGRTAAHPRWLDAIRRYLVVAAVGNLIWESAQLPLYTLWRTEPMRSLVRAVLHCTAGDMVIAAVTLVIALATLGNARWPDERLAAVAAAVVATGVAYTIGSEYLNTVVRRSWTYTEWMPTLPWAGTGLAPLAQWVVVPAFALSSARRRPVTERNAPMYDMMSGGMMWGMGWAGLLVVVVAVLGIAALVKYLFFNSRS